VTGLRVLVVDDEAPARDDLVFLLKQQPSVEVADQASDATEALRRLQDGRYDGLFLDIRMPGLTGLELASLLKRFTDPPVVIFVTAYEEHAVAAFETRARDYLLKPVSAERLTAALEVLIRDRGAEIAATDDLAKVAVDTAGRTLLVDRDDVFWVEANGDYVRLHTASGGAFLVRLPMAALEERWSRHGFVRIHRSHLVALRHVAEVRTDAAGAAIVRVAGIDLPVSRRHTADLKAQFLRGPARSRS
jgi:two-component system LytT family response regulator